MNNVFAWLMSVLAFIPGLGVEPAPMWNGYAEVDYDYASAQSAGRIDRIAVREGDRVTAGDVLFVLESSQQQAQLDASRARADAAQASLDNLKTGSRSEEIDVIRASLMKAEADLSLAQQNLKRSEELFGQGLIPAAQLDQARAAAQSAAAAVEQLKAQLKVAELPARDAQQIAAEANLAAAAADTASAAAALDMRTIRARATGRVERLFYSEGEVVNAGAPVASLAGDGALRVKFYVSESERPGLALGQRVEVTCDGCAAGLTATIAHFSSDPQFTPPIIYSRDERQRLVFLTEAVMDQRNDVLPGQPVSIGPLE
jgi:HlyD family secretion protein